MKSNVIGIALIGLTLLAASPAFAGDTATATLQLATLEAPITTTVQPEPRVRTFRAPVARSIYVCSPSGFGRTSKCTTRDASRNAPVRVEISGR